MNKIEFFHRSLHHSDIFCKDTRLELAVAMWMKKSIFFSKSLHHLGIFWKDTMWKVGFTDNNRRKESAMEKT